MQAEAQCREILAMRPNEPEALHLLALVEYQSGRFAEAIGHMKRAATLAPEKALYHAHLAEICRRAGRLREAVTAGRRAVKLRPNDAETLASLGDTLFRSKNYEEAKVCHSRVVALKPDWAAAWHKLAEVLDALGEDEEAAKSRERAGALAVASGEGPPQSRPASLKLTPEGALLLARQHCRAGRLRAAEALCRRVLEMVPNFADAEHMLGIVAFQEGRFPAAISHLKRATELDSAVARYHCDLAEAYRRSGRADLAEASACRALSLEPENAAALNNLGVALYELERFEEALGCYAQAIAINDAFAEAYNNRGNVLRMLKRREEAEESYRRALAVNPHFREAKNNLCTTLCELGKLEEAESVCRQALIEDRRDPTSLGNLALVLRDLGRLDEAANLLERALSIAPGTARLNVQQGSLFLERGQVGQAAEAAERALALAPESHEALNLMGRVAMERGRPQSALACFRRAIEFKPDAAESWNNAGNALRVLGRIEEARDAFNKAVEFEPLHAGTYVNLADCMTFAPDDPLIEVMETLSADDKRSPDDRIYLNFALAKALRDTGDHRRAFDRVLAGNRAKRALVSYDEEATLGLFDRIEKVFTTKRIASLGSAGNPSKLPIFIFGMPRSGTTLVEQILASHKDVTGAGELDILPTLARAVCGSDGKALAYPEFVPLLSGDGLQELGTRYLASLGTHAGGAARVTDKMPANFLFAGLIHLMLPEAVMIHVVRDPVDTCLSCFFKLFSGSLNYTYDLGELGRYYRRYEKLMAHWEKVLPPSRIVEVRYEKLVADLEGEARRILEACELEWDPRCLTFHETMRPVYTASATQVREPLFKSSVGRARGYRSRIRPLLKALGEGR